VAKLSLIIALLFSVNFAAHAEADTLKPLNLLLESNFHKLSPSEQKSYIKKVKANLVEFEKRYNQDYGYAQNGFNFFKLNEAFADDSVYGSQCVIGGLERTTYKNADGRFICPTSGRSCGAPAANGFKCGKIFAEVCVDRTHPETISKSCAEAFDKLDAAKKKINYDSFKTVVENYYKDVCSTPTAKQKEACDYLDKQMKYLAADNGQKSNEVAKCKEDAEQNRFGRIVTDSTAGIWQHSSPCQTLDPEFHWNDTECKITSFSIDEADYSFDFPIGEAKVGVDKRSTTDIAKDLGKQIRKALDEKKMCPAKDPKKEYPRKDKDGKCDDSEMARTAFGEQMRTILTGYQRVNPENLCNVFWSFDTDSKCHIINARLDVYKTISDFNNEDEAAAQKIPMDLTEDQYEKSTDKRIVWDKVDKLLKEHKLCQQTAVTAPPAKPAAAAK
jgi:hypothetical protein